MEHCPHQALDIGGIIKDDNPIQHLIEKKTHYKMKREKLQKECLPGIPGRGARVWVARGLGGGGWGERSKAPACIMARGGVRVGVVAWGKGEMKPLVTLAHNPNIVSVS